MLTDIKFEYVKEKVFTISLFFLFYVVAYTLSKKLGVAYAIKTIGIIYLPSGARLIACLVGRVWGAIGVGIAAWLVVSPDVWPGNSDMFYMSVAFINSCSVLFIVLLVQKILNISADLSNLKLIHLPVIDLAATFAQALCLYVFLLWQQQIEELQFLSLLITQITGNFIGGI
jgi:integral membrane sensor domain MASE1